MCADPEIVAPDQHDRPGASLGRRSFDDQLDGTAARLRTTSERGRQHQQTGRGRHRRRPPRECHRGGACGRWRWRRGDRGGSRRRIGHVSAPTEPANVFLDGPPGETGLAAVRVRWPPAGAKGSGTKG
uniref:(northern house mosquito) hypothetical protein n=1 Tax=Culex pipiens TaxID=7175 RepID=A0A8D8C3X9_CULPI